MFITAKITFIFTSLSTVMTFYDLHIFTVIYSPLHRSILEPTQWPAPSWLASSVGRALQINFIFEKSDMMKMGYKCKSFCASSKNTGDQISSNKLSVRVILGGGLPCEQHLHQKDSIQHLKESASKPWLCKSAPKEIYAMSHLQWTNHYYCQKQNNDFLKIIQANSTL